MNNEYEIKYAEYVPTITLEGVLDWAVRCGSVKLKPGQWVRRDGQVGRFLYNRGDGIYAVSWRKPGESFNEASRRFKEALAIYRERATDKRENTARQVAASLSLGDRLAILFKVV